jgi:hypothetical protein
MNRVSDVDYPQIPAARRKAMLAIWNGAADMHAVFQALHFLDCHAPIDKLDAMLGWLISNKLTGGKFLEFLRGECRGSYLELQRTLLMRIEKVRIKKPILIGKDFRA